MNAVKFKNLSFKYLNSDKFILENANFSLTYGKFVLLSGPSGEGKSTMLSLINGIIPHCIRGEIDGEIYINDELCGDMTMAKRSRLVGSVLQNADSQIIHALVEDEIAFGCENMKIDPDEIKERVINSSKKMKLELDWKTSKLSGGQKQSLITASTLVMGQKILIFDEPLANLDLQSSHLLLSTLKKLAKDENYAILFIEHRIDIALSYVDEVLWLEDKKIMCLNSKKDALTKTMKKIEDCTAPQISDEVLLSVKNISFTADGREILKDISFDIRKGERIVILGENGCGKTTLLRIISGLCKASSGTIKANFKDKLKIGSVKWFKKVGFVYQNPSYQMFLSDVRSEVSYNAQTKEDEEDIVKEFALEPLLDMHPHSLSEGQKRRVSIASIASAKGEILLLDEPTVGQDFTNLTLITKSLMRQHEKTNNAVVTITHDYRCADAFAATVIWIKDGVIYKKGSKELIEEYFCQKAEMV